MGSRKFGDHRDPMRSNALASHVTDADDSRRRSKLHWKSGLLSLGVTAGGSGDVNLCVFSNVRSEGAGTPLLLPGRHP